MPVWLDLPGTGALIEASGYLAAGLVFATFWMRTMSALRWTGIASNLAFIAYGLGAGLTPVLVLHLLLLPLNLHRLRQMRRLITEIDRSASGSLSLDALVPFMKRRAFTAGEAIVRKGDPARSLFYLTEGELAVAESDAVVGAGELFGEVGLFEPGGRRSATLVARTDGVVMSLPAGKVMELCRQEPDFGFQLMRLLARRLVAAETRVSAAPGRGGG